MYVYILVETINREILSPRIFASFEEARTTMADNFMETLERYDDTDISAQINDADAWINADNNEIHWDAEIFKVKL